MKFKLYEGKIKYVEIDPEYAFKKLMKKRTNSFLEILCTEEVIFPNPPGPLRG